MNIYLKEFGLFSIALFLFFGLVYSGSWMQSENAKYYLAHGEPNISSSKQRPQADQIKNKVKVLQEMAAQKRAVAKMMAEKQKRDQMLMRQAIANMTVLHNPVKEKAGYVEAAKKIQKTEIQHVTNLKKKADTARENALKAKQVKGKTVAVNPKIEKVNKK